MMFSSLTAEWPDDTQTRVYSVGSYVCKIITRYDGKYEICDHYVDDVLQYRDYRISGRYHREDGPAYIHATGTKEWWINAKKHRLDGPAVEKPDGTKEWWLNGQLILIEQPKPSQTLQNDSEDLFDFSPRLIQCLEDVL
jgi:hypothetical protein